MIQGQFLFLGKTIGWFIYTERVFNRIMRSPFSFIILEYYSTLWRTHIKSYKHVRVDIEYASNYLQWIFRWSE